jgi:hypothetical protein
MTPYPDFFDAIPTIRVRDPLAALLGVSADGCFVYRYLDAVKLAGHSCPTVAAAWNMTRLALAALYGEALPCRGEIRVALSGNSDQGVTGVIASVVSLITGAAAEGGFKGLAGQFQRQNLLRFAADIPLELRFTRLDTRQTVDLTCDTGAIPAAPELAGLLRHCLQQPDDLASRQRFGQLWQERVRWLLLEQGDDPQVFMLRLHPAA